MVLGTTTRLPDWLREDCERHPPLLAVLTLIACATRWRKRKQKKKGGNDEIAHFAVSGGNSEFEWNGVAG